jgi:predicted DNA-binding transcriptional regulator AlpA
MNEWREGRGQIPDAVPIHSKVTNRTRSGDIMTTTDHDILTITEAAGVVRAPVATLRYWRHLGMGPRSFRIGRRVVYRRADVDEWISAQLEQTRSDIA